PSSPTRRSSDLGRARLESLRHGGERPLGLEGLDLAQESARNGLAEFLRGLRLLGAAREEHTKRGAGSWNSHLSPLLNSLFVVVKGRRRLSPTACVRKQLWHESR